MKARRAAAMRGVVPKGEYESAVNQITNQQRIQGPCVSVLDGDMGHGNGNSITAGESWAGQYNITCTDKDERDVFGSSKEGIPYPIHKLIGRTRTR